MRALGVFWISGESHAAADLKIQPVFSKEDGLAHHLLNTFCHHKRRLLVGLRQQNDEFIAAVAESVVDQAQLRFDLKADFLQEFATHQVTVSVIDVLEMVQVKEDYAEFVTETGGAIDL